MGIEYKIKFRIPEDYDASSLFSRLPSPIARNTMTEIYNFAIETDGFYFIDNLVNAGVASHALRQFIDEALRLSPAIEIKEP